MLSASISFVVPSGESTDVIVLDLLFALSLFSDCFRNCGFYSDDLLIADRVAHT